MRNRSENECLEVSFLRKKLCRGSVSEVFIYRPARGVCRGVPELRFYRGITRVRAVSEDPHGGLAESPESDTLPGPFLDLLYDYRIHPPCGNNHTDHTLFADLLTNAPDRGRRLSEELIDLLLVQLVHHVPLDLQGLRHLPALLEGLGQKGEPENPFEILEAVFCVD